MDSKLGNCRLGEISGSFRDALTGGDQFEKQWVWLGGRGRLAEVLRADGRARQGVRGLGKEENHSHLSPVALTFTPTLGEAAAVDHTAHTRASEDSGPADGAAVGLASRRLRQQAFCHKFQPALAWPVGSGHHYQL